MHDARGQITATRASHISLLRAARMSITEVTLHRGVHSNHQGAAIRGVRPVIYPLALVVVRVQHPSTRAFPYLNHLLRINVVTKKWCLQWQSLMHVPWRGSIYCIRSDCFATPFLFFHYKASLLQPLHLCQSAQFHQPLSSFPRLLQRVRHWCRHMRK